jgi:hypothetical protein
MCTKLIGCVLAFSSSSIPFAAIAYTHHEFNSIEKLQEWTKQVEEEYKRNPGKYPHIEVLTYSNPPTESCEDSSAPESVLYMLNQILQNEHQRVKVSSNS